MESKNTEPNSDETSTSSARRHSDEEAVVTARPKKRAGRRVFKETRHPIFRGVRRRNNDKWVCELRRPETQARIWLGTYPTPEMAARAHDVAALALKGTSAALNFPDSAWRLAIPTSLDPKDIRAAAIEAAEEFRPMTEKKKEEEDDDVDQEGRVFYMDEEFDMPGMFADMAQGLLLPPPPIGAVEFDDDVEGCDDVVLWSYSV